MNTLPTLEIGSTGCFHGFLMGGERPGIVDHMRRVLKGRNLPGLDIFISCGDTTLCLLPTDPDSIKVPAKYRKDIDPALGLGLTRGTIAPPWPLFFVAGNHESGCFWSRLRYACWLGPMTFASGRNGSFLLRKQGTIVGRIVVLGGIYADFSAQRSPFSEREVRAAQELDAAEQSGDTEAVERMAGALSFWYHQTIHDVNELSELSDSRTLPYGTAVVSHDWLRGLPVAHNVPPAPRHMATDWNNERNARLRDAEDARKRRKAASLTGMIMPTQRVGIIRKLPPTQEKGLCSLCLTALCSRIMPQLILCGHMHCRYQAELDDYDWAAMATDALWSSDGVPSGSARSVFMALGAPDKGAQLDDKPSQIAEVFALTKTSAQLADSGNTRHDGSEGGELEILADPQWLAGLVTGLFGREAAEPFRAPDFQTFVFKRPDAAPEASPEDLAARVRRQERDFVDWVERVCGKRLPLCERELPAALYLPRDYDQPRGSGRRRGERRPERRQQAANTPLWG